MALIDNLQAYYELEESSSSTASDSHSTNDGTYVGNLPTAVTGKIGNAQDLDGAGDYVDCNFQPDPTGGFTVNVWFKTSSTNKQKIASQWGAVGAGNASWGIEMSTSTTGKITFQTYDGSNGYSFESSSAYNDGNWHMATLVFDGTGGSGTLRGYVDGSEANTSVSADIQQSTNYDVLLGAENGAKSPFTGQLDESGVWERGYTTDEVLELYNDGDGFAYPFTTFNPALRRRLLA